MANTEELDAVCRNLADLLAAAPGPIRRIRVRSGDTDVEVEWPDGEIVVTPSTAPAAVTNGVATANAVKSIEDISVHYVASPMVGTFYRAPEPGAPPFVREGDVVRPGQQVAILEAMKMMMPVEADRGGKVKAVLAADAGPVEYGERLFAISVAEA